MVVVHELIQILREGDVARVDAPLPVIHDDIDGQPVITIEGTLFRQEIEQLLLAGRLADTPAEQGIEGEVSPFAPLQQPAHIECLGQGDHRHGGFHPQVESGSTRSLFRINCYFHLCLICFYVYTFVSRDHYLPSYQVMNLVQMQMNVSRITFDHLSKLVFEKSSMMIRYL